MYNATVHLDMSVDMQVEDDKTVEEAAQSLRKGVEIAIDLEHLADPSTYEFDHYSMDAIPDPQSRQDEMAAILEKLLASGEVPSNEVASLVARCGLMGPTDFIEDMLLMSLRLSSVTPGANNA